MFTVSRLLAGCLAVGLCTVVPVPAAWADATDAKFLDDIATIGVSESQTTLIAAAHKICTLHARGWNDDEIDATSMDTFPSWGEGQYVMLLIDSVADCCPEYLPPGVPR